MRTLITAAIAIFTLHSCVPEKERITSTGLYLFSVGAPFETAFVNDLPGITDRDTTFIENEYKWRGLILQYPNGKVYIEEDFDGEGIINRIHIETPDFRLKNGLKTGDLVKNLRAKSTSWVISPLPAYHLFDFYSSKFPSIHFLVSDDALPYDLEEYKIAQFDGNDRVVGIVVF